MSYARSASSGGSALCWGGTMTVLHSGLHRLEEEKVPERYMLGPWAARTGAAEIAFREAMWQCMGQLIARQIA